MYEAVTRNLRVTVDPHYLEDESAPEKGRYIWAYTVEICNEGDEIVQLINRYWHITDARGQVQEVRGPGVVGEQPVLSPGEAYTYTSGCPLATSSGIMVGAYEMETVDGSRFRVSIPAFSLDIPDEQPTLN
ncbi:Co2+/Mg2+ efflux protein ApaG [Amorphus orientalis]|uniref:Protein ApaG n=1 Tax=Amorphus orientalis TaxID=649198 RepID=A0AAE3VL03_9HYPH|nr:Co2+/Mg2+ efflux protein ApaG [Amorphus orientalis]MDQ0313927.1 ApaG protein [Amorphus orientalis]